MQPVTLASPWAVSLPPVTVPVTADGHVYFRKLSGLVCPHIGLCSHRQGTKKLPQGPDPTVPSPSNAAPALRLRHPGRLAGALMPIDTQVRTSWRVTGGPSCLEHPRLCP